MSPFHRLETADHQAHGIEIMPWLPAIIKITATGAVCLFFEPCGITVGTAVLVGSAVAAGTAIYWGSQIYQAHKADINQVRDAARIVSREAGCRPPNPEDFNTVHNIIKYQKGTDSNVPWNDLLSAWREVLCK